MTFRIYDQERDAKAVLRIYREVGWADEKAHEEASEQLAHCAGEGGAFHVHPGALVADGVVEVRLPVELDTTSIGSKQIHVAGKW